MGRWLVILTLAMSQCPDIVAADPKPSDVPLPPPRPVRAPAAKAAVTTGQITTGQVTTQVPAGVSPAGNSAARPAAEFPVQVPAAHGEATGDRRRRTAGECYDGGKKVVSAYYWEGKHTASGQPFNPHGLTAAHRTLPFGTRLTVSNPRNGKSIVVVVNDRGPFVSGISLDLSLGAAQAIGLNGTGTVCIQ
jgi:rare lipoprotein A